MSRRLVLSGLVMVCLSGAAMAAVESPAVANHGTQLGWRYLKEGDYARAERIFEQVLNQDPKDMKAWEGYNAAFKKRKAQEEGGAAGEDAAPAEKQPAPAPAEGDAEKEKKPARKPKAKAAAEDSGDEDKPEAAEPKREIGKVDPSMLRNKKRAKERYEKLREELTQDYRRQHSGAVEVHCTYYDPQLYRYLIEDLGAQKGYTAEKAQKLYESCVRDMKNQLEFYLKLVNYSKGPKLTVGIGDLQKKLSLVDDEGNSYEPARWKSPKGTDLVSDDAMTVWFNRTDSDGEDIIKKAGKGNLYLVISDLPHEQKQIQFTFKASRLSGETQGKASGSKSLMDRVKDLWK